MTAGWFNRLKTAAGRLGWSRLDGRRLTCCAEVVFDESCPPYEDQFLSIQIAGRIATVQDQTDTDLAVEILDVTDGAAKAEKVLSLSPDWRRTETPEFYYRAHNGVIPYKDAVLVRPITAARVPLHLLRFARRGRRKLQVTVAVLARPQGQAIASACAAVEYVCCNEGYLEIQQRREDVLCACVELACAAVWGGCDIPQAAAVIQQWIARSTQRFTPRSDIAAPLKQLADQAFHYDLAGACECVMAWGQKSDRAAAFDAALEAVAVQSKLTESQQQRLWSIADKLGLSPEQTMEMCQKRLLTPDCPLDRWPLLLGVYQELSAEDLRRRLTEEYRRWNARVTHTDPKIRMQADVILTLIAELRSRQDALMVNP